MVVPILILERLGKPYLPLGGKDWPMLEPIPQDMMFVTFFFLTEVSLFRKDMYDAYARLTELGITHMDIKYGNILKTPETYGDQCQFYQDETRTTQNESSPMTRRSHKCRLINFKMLKKSNFRRARLNRTNDSYRKANLDSASWESNWSE